MRTAQRSRAIPFVFLFILSVPLSLAFEYPSWSHRHMFKRAYGVDRVLAAVPNGRANPNHLPTQTPPSVSLPPIVPTFPLQSPASPTTSDTPTTSLTPPDTTSTDSTSSTPTTTSTTPSPTSISPSTTSASSSSSSSSSSSITSSTLTPSSDVQATSSTAAPVVDQASPTVSPTTLVVAPSPSPDAFTSALPPSPTPTQSSSAGSFFTNTGAVAGTFTVVGLFGIAGIVGIAMLIVRRRHSRPLEEDMEFLDKAPDPDPPMREMGSVHMEDDSMTDYGAPPIGVASPPNVYYPDHAYPIRPQGYPAEAYATQGYMQGYTAGYGPQHIYRPEDYNIAYPPQAAHPDSSMLNPHSFADVELGSSPVPSTQATANPVPDALRPTVQSTLKPTQPWIDTRFSVDSFYTGTATETSPTGLAF